MAATTGSNTGDACLSGDGLLLTHNRVPSRHILFNGGHWMRASRLIRVANRMQHSSLFAGWMSYADNV